MDADPHIVLTAQARRDLAEIFDWIAADTSDERADLVLKRIGRGIETLATMPSIGKMVHDLRFAPRTYTIARWRVFYRTAPGEEGIIVLRVLDGRRDVARAFEDRIDPSDKS